MSPPRAPGGIHLLNGLYDAKLDRQPVLAITGMPFHDLIHTHQQQDVLLDRLFEDVAVYSARVMGASHVENVAELACRTALGYRGVSHVTIPIDLRIRPASGSATRSRSGWWATASTRSRLSCRWSSATRTAASSIRAQPAMKDWWRLMEERSSGKMLDQALAAPGPVVVGAVVDPFEPPSPPQITPQQAVRFAEALIRGEPNRERIAITAASDRVREII